MYAWLPRDAGPVALKHQLLTLRKGWRSGYPPVVVDVGTVEVRGSGFVDQTGPLGRPVLRATPAGVVLVEVVGQGVPAAPHAHHHVVAEYLQIAGSSKGGQLR